MVLEVLARTVLARPGKDITGIQLRKEEVKLSLFADDVILYWENLKDCIKELLELKKNVVKLQDSKSTRRNQACSYALTHYLKSK